MTIRTKTITTQSTIAATAHAGNTEASFIPFLPARRRSTSITSCAVSTSFMAWLYVLDLWPLSFFSRLWLCGGFWYLKRYDKSYVPVTFFELLPRGLKCLDVTSIIGVVVEGGLVAGDEQLLRRKAKPHFPTCLSKHISWYLHWHRQGIQPAPWQR